MRILLIVLSCLFLFACQKQQALPNDEVSEISRELAMARAADSVKRSTSRGDNANAREEVEAAAKRIKFSGTYEIMYQGYNGSDSERYELKANGVAVWTHKARSGSSTKSGTWTAGEEDITVSITGNTGVISEGFALKGKRLVSKDDKNRYLRKLY